MFVWYMYISAESSVPLVTRAVLLSLSLGICIYFVLTHPLCPYIHRLSVA